MLVSSNEAKGLVVPHLSRAKGLVLQRFSRRSRNPLPPESFPECRRLPPPPHRPRRQFLHRSAGGNASGSRFDKTGPAIHSSSSSSSISMGLSKRWVEPREHSRRAIAHILACTKNMKFTLDVFDAANL